MLTNLNCNDSSWTIAVKMWQEGMQNMHVCVSIPISTSEKLGVSIVLLADTPVPHFLIFNKQ
jgi:hypothetical protein